MKKALLISVCATTLMTSASHTLAGESGPGCGVGTTVWSGDTGLFAHTSAGTTNGTFMNSFAISSGTSGCDASKQVQRSDNKEVFIASNMDTLSQEIAQGHGNYLTTLASIMGINKTDQVIFAASLQNEFGALFPSSSSSTTDVVAAIDKAMLKETVLAKYVRNI